MIRAAASPLYLDVEALDVVVANPFIALVGIGHVLGGIPSLGGSRVQECADLGKKGQRVGIYQASKKKGSWNGSTG